MPHKTVRWAMSLTSGMNLVHPNKQARYSPPAELHWPIKRSPGAVVSLGRFTEIQTYIFKDSLLNHTLKICCCCFLIILKTLSLFKTNQASTDLKLSIICQNIFSDAAPACFSDILSVYTPSRQLRSSADTRILHIPHVQTKTFG